MEKKIIVSVLCIAYNQDRFIRQALEGFVMQRTNFNFEVIIGDDCSTDKTRDIIGEFEKEYPDMIKPVYREKNIGVMANLIDLFHRANGKYIALCEGDDFFIDEKKLQLQVDFLDKNPNYSICFHPVSVFFENKEEQDSVYPDIKDITSFTTLELLKKNFIQTNSVMYRKNIYYSVPVDILPADWYLHLYHAKFGKIGFINKVMAKYRRHSDGVWWDSYKNIDSLLRKYGFFHLVMYFELLHIYGDNLEYKKIIFGHISLMFKKIIKAFDGDNSVIGEIFSKFHNEVIEFFIYEKKEFEDVTEGKDLEIQALNKVIKQKDAEIKQKDAEIEVMKSSKFWKMRNKYLKFKGLRLQYLLDLLKKSFFVFKKDGVFVFLKYAYKYLIHGREYFKSRISPSMQDYYSWIEKNEKYDIIEIKNRINNFKNKPRISIITPVYNVDPKWLDMCIESVIRQSYENWELCLHDDASTNEETTKCLKKWEKSDSRIIVSYGKENQHISGASNDALKLASGEFIALLDNDDELSQHALYEVVNSINSNTEIDFIYSDEDKIESNGMRVDPYFKPNWSLKMFLSMNYTTHFSVYRKSIINDIGGFRKGVEGSQDYDLALRFIEKIKNENIIHIPKILYHWRKIEGSTASRTDSKNYAYVAAKKAISDYVDRNKINGTVIDGIFLGAYRIKRELVSKSLVSIIIPTKDKIDYLKSCVLSVLNKTDYPNFEIIILDTGSVESETKNFYNEIGLEQKIRIINYPKSEFNFAEANTWAAEHANGEYLLFLNNDTAVINEDWLSSMMEYAQLKEVGVVGPKLLFPNDTIQHMGVVIGLREGASHAGVCFPEWQLMSHPFLHAKDVVRNVSAVTGACLLIRKKIFDKVHGFDKEFKIAFNDIDLCLKVASLGYEIIYTPYAKLTHYESITFGRPYDNPNRSSAFFEKERDLFNNKWKLKDFEDPFYNKNLTLKDESLSLKI